jgi:hypothetical protein
MFPSGRARIKEMNWFLKWSTVLLSLCCVGVFLFCAVVTEKFEQFWILVAAVPIVAVITFFMLRDVAKSSEPTINVIIQLFALIANFILLYAAIYRAIGIVDTKDHTTTSYELVDCIYFSIITWTTTGYGDFRPPEQARLIAASEALLGYVVMTIIIGIMARPFISSSSKQSADPG